MTVNAEISSPDVAGYDIPEKARISVRGCVVHDIEQVHTVDYHDIGTYVLPRLYVLGIFGGVDDLPFFILNQLTKAVSLFILGYEPAGISHR